MENFVTTEWMLKYSLATAADKQRMAVQMLQNLTVWLEQAGPAALQQEAQIIQRLQGAGVSQNIIASVRLTFANLRMVLQAAQQASTLPPQTLWRAMIDIFRQVAGSLAGGAQSIGSWMMNGARNVGQAATAAATAMFSIGRLVVSAAYTAVVAAIEATIGMEVFVNAVIILAIAIPLAMLANYFWKKNRQVYNMDDPLLKRMSQTSYVMPRPFYGNAH